LKSLKAKKNNNIDIKGCLKICGKILENVN